MLSRIVRCGSISQLFRRSRMPPIIGIIRSLGRSLHRMSQATSSSTPPEIPARSRGLTKLDSARYKLEASPLFQVASQGNFRSLVPADLHAPQEVDSGWKAAFESIVETVRQSREANSLLGPDGRTSTELIAKLGTLGLWGCSADRSELAESTSAAPIPRRACHWSEFFPLLTRLATIAKPVAGLASIHHTIGTLRAVDSFGTPDQRRRFLPRLTSGEALSAMGMTEPAAGSDLSAIRTTAVRQGEFLVISGEKCFITSLAHGRIATLIARESDRLIAAILPIPAHDSAELSLSTYALHPLKHSYNQGLWLREFRLPLKDVLPTENRSGLSVAYYGLNYGRVAVASLAAGYLRSLLADMLPWSRHRKTFEQAIALRPLVKHRIARVASLLVACDALVQYCGGLHDSEYRVELEAIVAKVFATEAVKEAAIDLALKTHGGRALLVGHPVGDSLHDYLASTIYEGEGDLLCLSLGRSLAAAILVPRLEIPSPTNSAKNPEETGDRLLEIWRRDFVKLLAADRTPWEGSQVQLVRLARRFMQLTAARLTLLKAAKSECEITRLAGEVFAETLFAAELREPESRELIARSEQLADLIVATGWHALRDTQPAAMMFPYANA